MSFRSLEVNLNDVLLEVCGGNHFQNHPRRPRGSFLSSTSGPASNIGLISRLLLDGSNVSLAAGRLLKATLADATSQPRGNLCFRNGKTNDLQSEHCAADCLMDSDPHILSQKTPEKVIEARR
jgi:hypothetical protein